MKNEKHEIANADSTTVPQKWLREKWYSDPKRKAIGASGKNIKIRVGSTISKDYAENYDKIFNNKSGEVVHTNVVNLSRHDTTRETIGVKMESYLDMNMPMKNMLKKAEIVVFNGETEKSLTKWMTPTAVTDYFNAIHAGLSSGLQYDINHNPHSRRLILNGPSGACWKYTSFLSNIDNTFTLVAHYRSMEKDHFEFDNALQWAIGKKAGVVVSKVIFMIDSYHEYL